MVKFRGYSIVLHDSHKGSQGKTEVEAHVKKLNIRQFVIAEEEYNHQEGKHIHLFLQLVNQTSFKTMLTHWCSWYKSGRVQVDQMRGDMSQACKYIHKNHGMKDKYYDPNPILYLDAVIAEELNVETQIPYRTFKVCVCPKPHFDITFDNCTEVATIRTRTKLIPL
jgi:hypothetical protein